MKFGERTEVFVVGNLINELGLLIGIKDFLYTNQQLLSATRIETIKWSNLAEIRSRDDNFLASLRILITKLCWIERTLGSVLRAKQWSSLQQRPLWPKEWRSAAGLQQSSRYDLWRAQQKLVYTLISWCYSNWSVVQSSVSRCLSGVCPLPSQWLTTRRDKRQPRDPQCLRQKYILHTRLGLLWRPAFVALSSPSPRWPAAAACRRYEYDRVISAIRVILLVWTMQEKWIPHNYLRWLRLLC
jgi:hypothetical protein